ncbi:Methylated-DNA--protein-cysteine methyltransferase [Frankliniella fusca]|uniref:Methylated-DNA--protein-cysteine methyltransferase n=1 Tax=Frankliniella fusca TaxID=407009 RepID=A0AAE1I1S9_9NEOP|nr:Methylated-DNA--protein-cysteine methyltransferase [Frankliniella fusca]
MHSKKKDAKALPCQDGKVRDLETVFVSTPIGDMVIVVCQNGLHRIYQKQDITDENFQPDIRKRVELIGPPCLGAEIKSIVEKCVLWLQVYFQNPTEVSKIISPNLCPIKSEGALFRDRVLLTLAKSTPAGKTITYGELASMAGSPGAQQAVGTTMATNPFQLLVPCHRVVKSGQLVGKYSGGCRNSVKIWLLEFEGMKVNRENGTISSNK